MSFSILFPTNQYASSSKSPEEIQKLTLPHIHSPPELITHIINKGIPLQFPYVYRFSHKYHTISLPFICQQLCIQQNQNQIIIIQSLQILLQKHHQTLKQSQLQTIFSSCLKSLNNLQSVNNQSMAHLIQLIIKKSGTNYKAFLKKIEQKCSQFGKMSQSIIQKVTAGRYIALYSKYTKSLRPEMIDIIKRILSINEIQTKKIWISQLFPQLLTHLDIQVIELHFQEKMFQLVYDQNQEISRIVVQTILLNSSKFSIQEQSTRIIKLFLDALSSKNQKNILNVSLIIGEVFAQLINHVFKNQNNSINFWKSLITLYNSKNETIINNLIYNLPGILKLSSTIHNIQPLCDLYIGMFYCPLADKLLLTKYFEEIVKMFPSKWTDLKEVVYEMMNELFESSNVSSGGIKMVNNIFAKLKSIAGIFLTDNKDTLQQTQDSVLCEEGKIFQQIFLQYLLKYMYMLINSNVSKWLQHFCNSLIECVQYLPQEFIDRQLAPKIYLSLKNKISNPPLFIKLFIILITKHNNPNTLNTYISKINIELCKSKISFQRQIALTFYHNLSFYISMELFAQYRIGQKFLSFNNDQTFRIRHLFISSLQRMQYFLVKEEKIELSLILDRLMKDNDYQIIQVVRNANFNQDDSYKGQIISENLLLRQKEKKKEINICLLKNQQKTILKSNKQLKNEEAFKKRVQSTKNKNKLQLRDVAKRKLTPLLIKTNSNFNVTKHA